MLLFSTLWTNQSVPNMSLIMHWMSYHGMLLFIIGVYMRIAYTHIWLDFIRWKTKKIGKSFFLSCGSCSEMSMGIVGVKSTAGREVKFIDPSKTTKSESTWLGYSLCDFLCAHANKQQQTTTLRTPISLAQLFFFTRNACNENPAHVYTFYYAYAYALHSHFVCMCACACACAYVCMCVREKKCARTRKNKYTLQ